MARDQKWMERLVIDVMWYKLLVPEFNDAKNSGDGRSMERKRGQDKCSVSQGLKQTRDPEIAPLVPKGWRWTLNVERLDMQRNAESPWYVRQYREGAYKNKSKSCLKLPSKANLVVYSSNIEGLSSRYHINR